MNMRNKKLLIILAVQVLLAALTWSLLHSAPETTKKTSLLNLEVDQIEKVEITAIQGEETTEPLILSRNGDSWVLASADDFPVQKEPVDKLLALLVDMKIDAPIATSKGNHKRLNVDNEAYDRKITITAAGKARTFYVGRSGRSTANVRWDGKSEVYEANGVSVWDINSRAGGYIEPTYLTVDDTSLTEVKVTNQAGTLHFAQVDGEWTIPGMEPPPALEEGAEPAADSAATEEPAALIPDAATIKGFVKKMCNLSIAEPVGKTATPEHGLGDGARVTLIGTKDGAPYTWEFTVGKQVGSQRFVKATNHDYVVKVPEYAVNPAVEKKVDDFLKDPTVETPAAPEQPMGMGMGNGQIPPEILEQLRAQGLQMPQ